MFSYRKSTLYCEQVSLADIAKEFGTPAYVYSAQTIRRQIADLKDTFSAIPDTTIAFAVKVNNNLSILKMLAQQGIGADIISRGELYRFLTAGGDPNKVMFAGVAKSKEEIAYAIDKKIFMFNVESIPEFIRINEIAKSKNVTVNAAIRINPDVEADTHDKITTGKMGTKFGISIATLKEEFSKIQSLTNVRLIGVDMHIGSQILSIEPFAKAYKVMANVVADLRSMGLPISVVDIGGGIGIPYDKEKGGFDLARYKKELIPILQSMNAKIILEPGRFVVGESGALVMNVEYIKKEWGKNFIIVDGGMNDYARVALYDAYNDILPVTKRPGTMKADIVGPVCESSDFFAKDRILTPVEQGDCIALMDAGAYGYSMASNYNARTFLPEVLVDGDIVKLIRKGQPIEDLIWYEKDLM